MKIHIRIVLWCSMLSFIAGSILSLYAKDYLDETMKNEYKAFIDKSILSMDPDSGDKFVLGRVVLGNNTYYVFRDGHHGNLEFVDMATVLLTKDSAVPPRYKDCSDISVCNYGEGKGRQLIVPVGYELRWLKADVNLTKIY